MATSDKKVLRDKNAWLLQLCFVAILYAVLFAKTELFVEIYVLPKWLAGVCSIGLYGLMFSVLLWIVRIENLLLPKCFIVRSIALMVLVQAIWGWWRLWQYDSIEIIAGSFDNPAGYASCLVIAFPFMLHAVKGRYTRIVISVFVLASIVMSQSRTGILCLLVIGLLLVLHTLDKKHILVKMGGMLGVVALSIWGLSCVKQASFNGRAFIYDRCLEMIADKPFFGWGMHGFETNYMKYQARYFATHPNAPESMVADMVKTPFNEYLYVTVNYGLVGLVCLMVCMGLVCWQCKKKKIPLNDPFLLSLIAIGVFALFSYPTYYPFTWLVLILDIMYIFGFWERFFLYWHTKKAYVSVVGGVLSVLLLGYMVIQYQREMRWKEDSTFSSYLSADRQVALLDEWYASKRSNVVFLYKYARALLRKGEYERCAWILRARECRVYDYQQAMLWGAYYDKLGMLQQAAHYYQEASCMCPAKFVPLYEWYKVCKKLQHFDQVKYIREQILCKPVKVDSPEVQQIRHAVLWDKS